MKYICQILILLFALFPAACSPAAVIRPDGTSAEVFGPNYECVLEEKGYLTSLVSGGADFAENELAGVTTSVLHAPGGNVLPDRRELGENRVVFYADGIGRVEYRFSDQGLTITLAAASEVPLSYALTLNRHICCVGDGRELQDPKGSFPAGDYRWVRGFTAMRTSGDAYFWGPFAHYCPVLTLDAAPGETVSADIEFLPVTDRERLRAAPALSQSEELLSPAEYQVFQRRDKYHGRVLVSGRAKCGSVVVKIAGKDLDRTPFTVTKTLRTDPAGGFSAWVDCPAGGWYSLDIKTPAGRTLARREHVGVGEVFVTAGQSNSTCCGEERQLQTYRMGTASDTLAWAPADDPVPGPQDHTDGGSLYPSFCDRLWEEFGVPVGVVPCGFGGTCLNDWEPGGDIFEVLASRIEKLGKGGFRAVLWHQGESDAYEPPASSFGKMLRIIGESKTRAGWEFPWFTAMVSYQNAGEQRVLQIRQAHRRLWQSGVSLQGPDTDVLTGSMRDGGGSGIHLSAAGLRAHGIMWATAVIPCIYEAIQ